MYCTTPEGHPAGRKFDNSGSLLAFVALLPDFRPINSPSADKERGAQNIEHSLGANEPLTRGINVEGDGRAAKSAKRPWA